MRPPTPPTPRPFVARPHRVASIVIGPDTWSALDALRRDLSRRRGADQTIDDVIQWMTGVMSHLVHYASGCTPAEEGDSHASE